MDVGDLLSQASGLGLPHAARLFAGSGVAVFPCMQGGKRPRTLHGFHDATTDTRMVAAWWRRWPAANIGVPTGSASGLEVVDVDVHAPGSGYGPFRRAGEAGLVSGWAALVRTPSGGMHVYYPADPSRPQPSWQAAAAQVDFRGNGGYIVAPPSAVARPDGSRVPYALIVASGTTPTPVDAGRLRNFLDPRPVIPVGVAAPIRELDTRRLAGWIAGRGEGERNRGLFWAACRLAEAGMSRTDVCDVLGPAAEQTGLSPREILVTIRSACRTTNNPHPGIPLHAGARDEVPRRAGRFGGQVLG